MTCIDVMYQPLAPAFPAYPRSACSASFSSGQALSRMHEPLDLGPSSSSSASSSYPLPSSLLTPSSSGPPSGNANASIAPPSLPPPLPPPPPSSSTSPPSALTASSSASASSSSLPPSRGGLRSAKEDHQHEKEGEPKGAHYLAANCVLLTYFNGDASKLVDDHFTRALNQSHSYGSPGVGDHGSKDASSKAPTPMAARNLPPSFWNSSYHQQQHHNHNHFPHHHPHHHSQNPLSHGSSSSSSSTAGSSDMGLHGSHYFSSALHGFSNLQPDPWAYGFPNPGASMAYPHRPVPYDLTYPSSSRFGQNYSSFLVQPTAMRSGPFGAMSGQSDVTKDHSRSRFGDHRLGSDYPSHSSFPAIDGLPEPTKDLYWF